MSKPNILRKGRKRQHQPWGKSTNNVDMSIRRGIWKKRVPSFATASGPIWGFPWWQQSCSLPYLRPTSEQPRGASRLIFLLPIYLDMDLEPEGKLDCCSNFLAWNKLKSEQGENKRAKEVIYNSCTLFSSWIGTQSFDFTRYHFSDFTQLPYQTPLITSWELTRGKIQNILHT